MEQTATGAAATLRSVGGRMADAGREASGFISHHANRFGEFTGANNAFKSIADSGAGKFVGNHKIAAGVVAASTVAAMAWHFGGNHREKAIMRQQMQARALNDNDRSR